MTTTRAEFRFQHKDHGEIVVQCIMRVGKVREFCVIIEGRIVRLGVEEVGDNIWACASHAERAAEKALDPKARRTPAIARAERRRRGPPLVDTNAEWLRKDLRMAAEINPEASQWVIPMYRLRTILADLEENAALREQVEALRGACEAVIKAGCPRDTNGDGDCGRRLCSYCGEDIRAALAKCVPPTPEANNDPK